MCCYRMKTAALTLTILALVLADKEIQIKPINNYLLPLALGNAYKHVSNHKLVFTLEYSHVSLLINSLTSQHELIFNKYKNIKHSTEPTLSEHDVNIVKLLKQCQNQIQSIIRKYKNFISFKRNKRSPFNFIGKAANWLFGVMDDDERKEIYEIIQRLKENQIDIVKNVNYKTTLLQTMFNQIQNLTNNINSNGCLIEKHINHLNEKVAEVDQYTLILEIIFILENNINEVETFINELHQSIILGFRNQLHPFLLPYSQLRNELNHLKALYPKGTLNLLNDHYYYSILAVRIGLDTTNLIISIEFPIVEDNNSTLYKIVKVPYHETYVLERCDYLVWSYNQLECVTNYFSVENKYIIENNDTVQINNNCVKNLLQNSVDNCTIVKIGQSPTRLIALNQANYVLITESEVLLKYKCKTKGTVTINKNSLIKLPLNYSIEFKQQLFVNSKEEVYEEMILPEITRLEFNEINTINQPFELTKINFDENLQKQIFEDRVMHPQEIPLHYQLTYYLFLILIIIVIIIFCKFKNKLRSMIVRKPGDSLSTRQGGVISQEIETRETLM